MSSSLASTDLVRPAKPATGLLATSALAGEEVHEYVTMTIAQQMFAIPVSAVRDVLGPQRITRIPLAPADIAGSLNLRGRIVTAIELRVRMGLPAYQGEGGRMSVVVDHGGELYSLLVDQVGEVLSLGSSTYERKPPTLDPRWAEVSTGIHRLNGALLMVLDVGRLLDIGAA